MNGPEHFRAAETFLAEAGPQPGEASARGIAAAQVHAVLAPAAATALHGVTDHRHWLEATGTQHRRLSCPSAAPRRAARKTIDRAESLAFRSGVAALYPGSHQGLGPLSEEGLEAAILVVAQAPGMTAVEDAALVEALDLEGSRGAPG